MQFDFGATYFVYPGETAPVGVTAVSTTGRRSPAPTPRSVSCCASPAASPIRQRLQHRRLEQICGNRPGRRSAEQDAAAGCQGVGERWRGLFLVRQSVGCAGGFPLPAYLNWNAGVTFTRKNLNLDLRYYDTNLSRDNCFVFTGDPNATPGGQINPLTNPSGLVSNWCSATFVAKFWFAFN